MKSKKFIKQTGDNSIAAINSNIFLVNNFPQNDIRNFKKIINNDQTRKRNSFFEPFFSKFANFFKSEPAISFETDKIIEPNLAVMLAKREDAVESLVKVLDNNTLLNLYGGTLTGKTHLIYLVGKSYTNQHNSQLFWFECGKGLKDNISEQLFSEMKSLFEINEIDELEGVLKTLPINSVFIFDDFPFNNSSENDKQFILTLLNICERFSFKIISSSATDINFRFKSLLKPNSYQSSNIPSFNENDVYAILDRFSNLDTKSKNHISKLIAGFSGQNPAICAAHIQLLKQHNWIIDDFVTTLIQKSFMIEDLENYIQDILTSTLVDQETRELLYRLSLVTFKFDSNLVQKLSSINPEISFFNEKFRNIEGYWVESFGSLYMCNPLIKNLGEKNINLQTLREVHNTLADTILNKKNLTPKEFINAFVHLIDSNNHNRAAFLLTHILKNLEESDVDRDYWSLTSIWIDTGLPKELDEDIAYLLKAQQIITRAKFDKPIEKLLIEFLKMTEEHDKHANEIAFYLTFYLSNYNIDITLDFFLEYNLFENAPSELLDENNWEVFIWIIASKIRGNGPALRKFVDILQLMSIQQFQNSLQDDIGYSSIQYLSTQTYINLKKDPIDLTDVNNTLDILNKLEEIGEKFQSNYFKIDVLSTKLIIFNEYEKDFEKTIKTYSEIQSMVESTENIFLLNYRMGKSLYFTDKKSESKPYLELASKNLTNHYEYESIDTLMLLATIEDENTLALLKLAEDKAVSSEFQLPMLLTRLYAELGTYYFLNNGNINCYKYYKKSWESKLSDDPESSNYKIAVCLLAHCTGYVSSIIKDGTPPGPLEDGDYVKPFIGSNWIHNEKVAELYKYTIHEQGICFHLASISESLEIYDDAYLWLQEICNNKNSSRLFMLSAYEILPYLINLKSYSTALKYCIEASLILYTSIDLTENERNLFDSIEVNLQSIEQNYYKEFYEKVLVESVIPIISKVFSDNQLNVNEKFQIIQNLLKDIDINNVQLNSTFIELDNYIKLIRDQEFANDSQILESKSSNEKTIFYIMNAEFVSIRQAAIYHIQIINILSENYSKKPFAINEIINKYFVTFWVNKFMNNWSDFKNPDKLQMILVDMSNKTLLNPAKSILNTLSEMYQLVLPAEIFHFLNNEA